MAILEKRKFGFKTFLPEDTFEVVQFKGYEALSEPYEFDITLLSEKEIEIAQLLNKRAKFYIYKDTDKKSQAYVAMYNGIIVEFEYLYALTTQEDQKKDVRIHFYRAKLVPALWSLSLNLYNQVFLDNSIPDIIKKLLGSAGSFKITFNLKREYPKKDFVCQYNESHLNFISRWLEREGMVYRFIQQETTEEVVITDDMKFVGDISQLKSFELISKSGLETAHNEEVINKFVCKYKLLPYKVILKDYNYEIPGQEIKEEVIIDDNGQGEVYHYYGGVDNADEAKRLADIIAQSYRCQREVYYGESSIPYFTAGFSFTLKKVNQENSNEPNKPYQIIKVKHEGDQRGFLPHGIIKDKQLECLYKNTFVCIPADISFKKELKTPKPKVTVTMSAFVDASGSGKYAEIDEMGRYKIKFPFDLISRNGGKASAPVRMLSPYGGKGRGMHFPIPKGAEVMITFLNGDPDRPVISGVLFNPDNPSPVTSENQTQCKIVTGTSDASESLRNEILIEDKEDIEAIKIRVPRKESEIILGGEENKIEINSDEVAIRGKKKVEISDEEYEHHSEKHFELVKGEYKAEVVLGEASSEICIGGAKGEVFLGGKGEFCGDLEAKFNAAIELACNLALKFAFEREKLVFGSTAFSLFESNFETFMEDIGAYIENVKTFATKMVVAAENLETTLECTKAAAFEVRTFAQKTETTSQAVSLLANVVGVAASSAQVVASELKSGAISLENAGLKVIT